MKKAFVLMAALGASVLAYAQDKPENLVNREMLFDVVHIIAMILVIYLISSFILQLVRKNYDFRLKSKIVEQQTDEQIVGRLVQPDRVNPLNTAMQWICTLASVGVGFLLIELTEPYGLHSLAIMAFCAAGGLGLYYFFARQSKK